MMILGGDLRPGVKIEVEGTPYTVVDYHWVKPGKGGAFMRTKLRNMRTGALSERTFRTEEKIPAAPIEEKRAQFLYASEEEYHFMDLETYEQFFLRSEHLGSGSKFLTEEMTITILFFKGEAVGVNLPMFVDLTVTETDPGVRGDTASGGSKPAMLETGAVIQVPLFISVGDRIRVDTRTESYIERV